MIKYFKLIVLLFVCSFASTQELKLIDDYQEHPCYRDCSIQQDPMICEYNFVLEWYTTLSRNCFNCTTNYEDCFEPRCISAVGVVRPVMVANRMLPGPSIQVCKHDTVMVNVKNDLEFFEATTIHFHGIKMRQTPFMDGVGFITQCPIQPHTTFQYKFPALDPGTHFWHAHSSLHRADGLFGSLVVRESNDVNTKLYDEDLFEHVIVLNDWTDKVIIEKFEEFVHNGESEKPEHILINGRGINVDKGSPKTPRSVFFVESGLRYRFRMINAGILNCPLEVSIDNHSLTLIALDGNPIEPTEVVKFNMFTGERADFILNANKPPNTYLIKVKGLADCEERSIFQTAVLKYVDSSSEPVNNPTYDNLSPTNGPAFNPTSSQFSLQNYILVDELRSSVIDSRINKLSNAISKVPDRRFLLAPEMNKVLNPYAYDKRTFELFDTEKTPFYSPQINNITFILPKYPLIYQTPNPPGTFCNSESRKVAECRDDEFKFCACTHQLNVNLNELVEVILVDGGTGKENHPFHLHGYQFAVIGQDKVGESVTLEKIKELDSKGLLKRNLNNPVFKDTVLVPSGGYVIIRFYANNPGAWIMHCHVDFHIESGMGLIFRVGDSKDLPPKPYNWPSCGDFRLDGYQKQHKEY